MKSLVLGGARSGKSLAAENRALDLVQSYLGQNTKAPLVYIATGWVGDDEMAQRVALHHTRRKERWALIEEQTALADVVLNCIKATPNAVILVDCLTSWISNCLHHNCWSDQRERFLALLDKHAISIVMVGNEVGSGIVPLGELSRTFVDESGRLNQELATLCDEVTLVVAGLSLPLKSPPA